MPRAVLLLSGGLDSATVLAIARHEGYEVHALSVDYGQRHRVELQRAAELARAHGVTDHRTVRLDLRTLGGSALTSDTAVPKARSENEMATGIPITYVPARNTILLGIALGFAEVVGAFDIFMGANVLDYSGYPDCRPEFLQAFESMANLATKAAVVGQGKYRVHAPLLKMTKAEIIRTGTKLGLDYRMTLSCYDPDDQGRACGGCDSCLLRKKGFAEASIADPTEYR